jgi:N-methylhydantoinase B
MDAMPEKASATISGVDPITFEVLRHRLWAINDEAAATLRRVSGSPVATEICDFNTSLMTADGDAFIVGVYMGILAGGHDLIAKYILREYADNPGIGPDDMFICNDPYVGAVHQSDVTLVAPVHWKGELVAWAGVTIHAQDVGGPLPGSQGSIGSTSIFQEPQPMPPLRIVEAGRLRRDLEREYLIRSRTAALNALDLRAKIAANQVAKQRIHGLIARYGLETVRTVMREMIGYTERRLRQRLRELPDGRWEHRLYLDDVAQQRYYCFHVVMEKQADRLSFDYSGSSPQAPAVINCTRVGLTAAVLTSVFPTLCFDLPWSPAGVLQVVDIKSRPGTVVDAEWPAGVAKATTSAVPMANTVAWVCLARMLSTSPAYRAKAMAPWMTVAPVQELFGTDRRGESFGATLLDNMAGGGGASSTLDGIDTGGNARSLCLRIANVETYELRYPVLYLHRRQQPDSGGAGRRRGGVGVSLAFVTHKVERIPHNIMHSINCEASTGVGLFGGYPASTNYFTVRRDSDIRRKFGEGFLPDGERGVHGRLEIVPGMLVSDLGADDVYHVVGCGGGGMGDPIDREPARVGEDVVAGTVSTSAAEALYGVVFGADGRTVDEAATITRRSEIRLSRAKGGIPRPNPSRGCSVGAERARISDTLAIHDSDAGLQYVCRCGHALGPASGNFKELCSMSELALQKAGPLINPHSVGQGRFVFRQFACPRCHTLLESEVAMTEDPILDVGRLQVSASVMANTGTD